MPSTFRRTIKNTVNNYTNVERQVREIFGEIMSMIWKRLNDHGKNWRHVYKALTLLDYLIKTGSERVVVQCKENIFAIQTLKDFQYIDKDGKDQGINVREKSKQLVVLLKDEDRLKAERSQALKTKERMAQVSTGNSMGFGRGSSQPNLATYSEEYGRSEGSPASYHGSTSPAPGSELEQARPQTSGEEELQIQLALAMSREAAEQEERLRRGDDLRLQMALEESKKKELDSFFLFCYFLSCRLNCLSLLSSCLPGSAPMPATPVDPWGAASSVPPVKSADPWAPGSVPAPSDPWGSAAARPRTSNTGYSALPCRCVSFAFVHTLSCVFNVHMCIIVPSGSFDLFSTSNGTSKEDFSEFDSLRSSSSVPTASSVPSQGSLANSGSLDIFDSLPSSTSTSLNPIRKTPESFLGPNAALVNLDSLVSRPAQPAPVVNPFLASAAPAAAAAANPFQVSQPAPPTLNQMRLSPMPSSFGVMGESAQPMTVVPLPGMASMGHMVPGMGVGAVGGGTMGAGIPASMSMPQPLMSMPPRQERRLLGPPTPSFCEDFPSLPVTLQLCTRRGLNLVSL
uniref:Epsin 2 n=2 Tax=Neogobius melanostomus TaxID=47308 RepID=A0A8C6UMD7_9GOBI